MHVHEFQLFVERSKCFREAIVIMYIHTTDYASLLQPAYYRLRISCTPARQGLLRAAESASLLQPFNVR